jgi:hypothetical protein
MLGHRKYRYLWLSLPFISIFGVVVFYLFLNTAFLRSERAVFLKGVAGRLASRLRIDEGRFWDGEDTSLLDKDLARDVGKAKALCRIRVFRQGSETIVILTRRDDLTKSAARQTPAILIELRDANGQFHTYSGTDYSSDWFFY